jgi:carbamoyl-phosphate synthase large subunit
MTDSEIHDEFRHATDRRIFAVGEALRRGWSPADIAKETDWDEFFVRKVANIVAMEKRLQSEPLTDDLLRAAKRMGFADKTIARLVKKEHWDIMSQRVKAGIIPVYKMVDTCAAEFAAETPYFYSTYNGRSSETSSDGKKRVVIIGGGPIRIGQGIEFDYCCVHAVKALQEEGIEAIMINNNPETVSTDYDISDRLYFEPLELEDVLEVIKAEDADGVICQYGGQTSVNLAIDVEKGLKGTRTKILGTTPDQMDVAEDRKRFTDLMRQARCPPAQAPAPPTPSRRRAKIADDITYPVLVQALVRPGRPRRWRSSTPPTSSRPTWKRPSRSPGTTRSSSTSTSPRPSRSTWTPSATGKTFTSAASWSTSSTRAATPATPPWCCRRSPSRRRPSTRSWIDTRVALALKIRGLMNLQLAYKDGQIFMIEANPQGIQDRPVHLQGHGRPPGQDRRQMHAGP